MPKPIGIKKSLNVDFLVVLLEFFGSRLNSKIIRDLSKLF